MLKRKVNLFMVGIAKCGTTTIHKILISHPDIFGGPLKEPHYFARNHITNVSKQFESMSALNYDAYLANYKNSSNQNYLIDSSVKYIHYPEIADYLYQYNPTAKIIIAVRNPIDRIYSHYKMLRKMGYIQKSFSEFLKNPYDHLNINLLEQGKNAKQIKHYLELFKPSNVMIVLFNEIVSDQNKLAQRLATFLDIAPFESKLDIHENVSEIPKNKLIKFLHNDFFLTKYLKRVVPKNRLRSKVGKFIMKNFYTKERMGNEERAFLNDYYAEEIQALKELGINL